MNDSAVKYIYGTVDSSYISNPTNIEDWATYILSYAYRQTSSTDAQISVQLWYDYYYAVLRPVDASGNYGTPVLVDSAYLWEGSTSSESTDDNVDSGMTPRM